MITLIASLIAGTAIAFLLPVFYKAKAIFLPLNPKSYDPKIMFSPTLTFDYFADGREVERLISVANSKKVLDMIVRKYDLGKVFKVDETDSTAYNRAIKDEYEDRIKIQRNENELIELTVLDQDKVRAANIANSIITILDSLNRLTFLDNNKKFLEHYKDVVQHQSMNLDTISKALARPESEILVSQAISNFQQLKETEASLAILNDKFSTLYVIESAYPPLKKEKPIRWLVVVLIVGGSLAACILYLAGVDIYKKEIQGILKNAK